MTYRFHVMSANIHKGMRPRSMGPLAVGITPGGNGGAKSLGLTGKNWRSNFRNQFINQWLPRRSPP